MTVARHPHAVLIERFYAAFARRDWEQMAACYHPDVHFSDEVFDLHGADVAAMWRMLCTSGKALHVKFSAVAADDREGRAHWDARYRFPATNRPVVNRIDARFGFRDGLIVRHVDRFDFWLWSRQALGARGWLLGWTPFLRNKVRAGAAERLAEFKQRKLGAAKDAAASG